MASEIQAAVKKLEAERDELNRRVAEIDNAIQVLNNLGSNGSSTIKAKKRGRPRKSELVVQAKPGRKKRVHSEETRQKMREGQQKRHAKNRKAKAGKQADKANTKKTRANKKESRAEQSQPE